MDAIVVAPPGELADVVEHSFRLDKRDADTPSWMVVPDPSAHLLVQRARRKDGSSETRCVVVGPRSNATEFGVGARDWSRGVRLRPGAGALPILYGVPASDFTNHVREVNVRHGFLLGEGDLP